MLIQLVLAAKNGMYQYKGNNKCFQNQCPSCFSIASHLNRSKFYFLLPSSTPITTLKDVCEHNARRVVSL